MNCLAEIHMVKDETESVCIRDPERPIKIKNKLVTFSKLDIVICLSAGRCLGQL